MAYRCDRCGKGKLYGLTHRHHRGVAGGQWKQRAPKTQKVSLPNLHTFRGDFDGKKGVWKFCTKCLRTVKKEQSVLKKVDVLDVAPKAAAAA